METTSRGTVPVVSGRGRLWQSLTGPAGEWSAVALFGLLAAALIVYPVLRAFSMVQVFYNEGWNVYNAVAAAHHLRLYPHGYRWTTVNYPALSFYVVAWLHRTGLGYLAAGRLIALISFPVCCLLVGLTVWRLNHDYRAALFSSFFCMALFCIAGNQYIGSDDPQMFAQVFFLCGFLFYISGPPRFSRLAITAFLFVLGGSIKHNLIGFPLAVLADLLLTGKKQVLQFLSIAAVLLGVSIYANTVVGGPFFVADILTPRVFSFTKAFFQFMEYGFGPIALAMIAAAIWSARALKDRRLRVLAIWFCLSVIFGAVSGGIIGVWVNSYFEIYLSLSIIVGLLMHRIWRKEIASRYRWAPAVAPLALFLCFGPVWAAGPPILPEAVSALAGKQARFKSEVSFLRAHPGPAFCESLLRCYEAGKPYLYDPFDSADLVRTGKLSPAPLIARLDRRQLTVVQLCCSTGFLEKDDDPDIIPQTLPVIEHAYQLALARKGCYIYVPRKASSGDSP